MASATTIRRIDVCAGTIEYTDTGSGPILVFVHGVFTNGALWSAVVPALASRFRCIVLTLPLGGHSAAMRPDADLSPAGIASLIAEVLDELDLRNVTLVGNDTGGALCQLVIANHCKHIAGLVLTNCDAFDYFPPRVLAPIYAAARIPGFVGAIAQALRSHRLQRLFFATVAHSEPSSAFLKASFEPFVNNSRVRGDLRKAIRAISSRATIAAALRFGSFNHPVSIVWGTDDFFFPIKLARRLARAFPNSRLRLVEGSRTFVALDKPMAVVTAIEELFAAPALE